MLPRVPFLQNYTRTFGGGFSQLLLASAICVATTSPAFAQGEVRAVWMTSSSTDSTETATRAVESAATSGYTALLVPVSLHSVVPPGFADLITRARARGLHVYASLNVNLATAVGELPASRDHVIYQHPEWLMVPRELAFELTKLDARSPEYVGRLARWTRAHAPRSAGLYVSPIHGDSIGYLVDAVRDFADRYQVDGLQLEALEYPDDSFDYSRFALDEFRRDSRARLVAAERARMDQVAAIDPFAYVDEYADGWHHFRQERLTTLVSRIRSAVKAVRPDAVISVAVTRDPMAALRDNLQDWRSWMDQGLVDAVSTRQGSFGSILFDYDGLFQPPPPAQVPAVTKNSDAGSR